VSTTARPLDRSELRFNQISIISLLVLAFVLNSVWLVAFVGLVMAVGTVWPRAGLFKRVYHAVIKPRGWLKPDVAEDTPAAHLFAQGVGALFLLASTVALLSGAGLVGWTLAWIVIILASVNLFLGFCVGCFVYYQLARFGIRVALPTWAR
jgi:hypothetical protein